MMAESREAALAAPMGSADAVEETNGEGAGLGAQGTPDSSCGQSLEERKLAEHNALAAVFDDVRKQSAASFLSEPFRWIELGIVPAHLTGEDFEMLVYEYLEDYRAEHKDEIAREAHERTRKRDAVRSATRAVGVPPKIPNRRLAEIEHDGAFGDAQPNDAQPNDAQPDKETAIARVSSAEALSAPIDCARVSAASVDCALPLDAGAGRDTCADSALDCSADQSAREDDPFAGLNIPEGYRLVELEGEYVLVPDENVKPKSRDIHCEHIEAIVGQHSYYLYDSDLMTKNYAHWLFLAAEDNPLATFVDCVREEGRVYPRPLAASDLANEPFRMAEAKVEQTWCDVRDSGDYPDIERCEASNGDVYFFSTLYLSRVLAESLAEYESVERKANV